MAGSNRRFTLAAVALPFLFLAMSGLARAATITVDTTSPTGVVGHCNLSDAIQAANSGLAVHACTAGTGNDTIEFSVTGMITTAAMLGITDTQLAITGPAGGITIDGGHSHEIMKADAGTTVTLKNLTFAHGSISGGGGAILADGAAMEVDNCTFSGNDAGEIGGAIDASAGTVTITNSTFAGNDGGLQGGGVGNTGSVLKITNSTFSGNEAVAGGALYTFSGTSDVKGTIFAASSGGGNCGSAAVTNDEGDNLSDDTSGCFTAATSKNNVSNLNLDPAGLQNNGGPTKTIALEPDSQAVDFIPVADCTDQSRRPAGADDRPARLSPARSRQSLLLRRRRIRIADDALRARAEQRKVADSAFDHSKFRSGQHGVYLHRERLPGVRRGRQCVQRLHRPASGSGSCDRSTMLTGSDAGAVGGAYGQSRATELSSFADAAGHRLGQDGRSCRRRRHQHAVNGP